MCPIRKRTNDPFNVSFCRNNRVLYGFYGIRLELNRNCLLFKRAKFVFIGLTFHCLMHSDFLIKDAAERNRRFLIRYVQGFQLIDR